MHLDSIKAAFTAVSGLAICTAGIANDLRTLSGWAVLAGLAVLPPLVTMWPWNDPRATISEIQEALR